MGSLTIGCLAAMVGATGRIQAPPAAQKRWLVAHRGASAYAPENTVPAFRLAADQGATFVEFDLQLTKDRQIVCLHDNSLERTTDVEEVFPDRFRKAAEARRPRGDGCSKTSRWPRSNDSMRAHGSIPSSAALGFRPSVKPSRRFAAGRASSSRSRAPSDRGDRTPHPERARS